MPQHEESTEPWTASHSRADDLAAPLASRGRDVAAEDVAARALARWRAPRPGYLERDGGGQAADRRRMAGETGRRRASRTPTVAQEARRGPRPRLAGHPSTSCPPARTRPQRRSVAGPSCRRSCQDQAPGESRRPSLSPLRDWTPVASERKIAAEGILFGLPDPKPGPARIRVAVDAFDAAFIVGQDGAARRDERARLISDLAGERRDGSSVLRARGA